MRFSRILYLNKLQTITNPITGKPIPNTTLKSLSLVLNNYFPTIKYRKKTILGDKPLITISKKTN